MTTTDNFMCVNCGEGAIALHSKDSSLKPLKCKHCDGILDKFIEYDEVIVMINLVLLFTEPLRHVLFNTPFKAYWKLLITLMLFETYGLWRTDSLFNIFVNSLCGFEDIYHKSVSVPLNHSSHSNCWAWRQTEKDNKTSLLYNLTNFDIFIWQKDFGIQLLSLFFGVISFLLILHLLMAVLLRRKSPVPLLTVLKAYSLADSSRILTLPMLVWGSELSLDTKTLHYIIVFGYSFVVFTKVFSVVYSCPLYKSVIVLILCIIAKYTTCYYVTPLLKVLFYDSRGNYMIPTDYSFNDLI